MASVPKDVVQVKVVKVKGKPFYATIGPGDTVLSANPMFDGVSGMKEMTQQEVYTEYERLLFMNWYTEHPEHYELLNTYMGPPDMDIYAKLDMRKKTLGEMKL